MDGHTVIIFLARNQQHIRFSRFHETKQQHIRFGSTNASILLLVCDFRYNYRIVGRAISFVASVRTTLESPFVKWVRWWTRVFFFFYQVDCGSLRLRGFRSKRVVPLNSLISVGYPFGVKHCSITFLKKSRVSSCIQIT